MKFNELLWIIKTLNLKPIRDLEITSYNNRFTILSPTKRVDIINANLSGETVCRYIRVYKDLDDLSTYFQTDFDKYMGKSEIDISSIKNRTSFDDFASLCKVNGAVDIDRNTELICVDYEIKTKKEYPLVIPFDSKKYDEHVHNLTIELYETCLNMFGGVIELDESKGERKCE